MRTLLRSAVIIGVLTLPGVTLWLLKTPEAPRHGADAPERRAQVQTDPREAPRPEPEAIPLLVSPASPVDVVPASQLHALQAQVQQCRQQLHAQQHALQHHQQELTRLQEEAARGSEAVTSDAPGESGASQEDREAGQVAQLEAALSSERLDPRWSQAAVKQIAAAVEQIVSAHGPEAGGGSALLEANCYATLCRIVLEHDSRETMENFLGEFPHQPRWQASTYINIHANPDDGITTVIFLSREGHPLPEIDN
jgi:hypothetical protein